MKENKLFGAIVMLLFIIFVIIFAVQIILKLTGHSPTDIQVLYTGFGVIISYLLIMSYKMGVFVGEVKGFMNSFKKHK